MNIRFEPLSSATDIVQMLSLVPPAGIRATDAFRQLEYVLRYVLDPEIGCTTIAIEDRYIDRDFMEDHGTFYGRSFHPYPNYCRRIHFFKGAPEAIEKRLIEIVVQSRGQTKDEYLNECRRLSDEMYFGFCVIKPLDGTPVGRTVLRPFPNNPAGGSSDRRRFDSTRIYKTHLAGVELSVPGLAFQQQDVGVAACATTAIWTALQKLREAEELSGTTPAHITAQATQGRLPFGRSMPSEGLSIDQMSQAVQSFGLSPVLTRVESEWLLYAEIFSATLSGMVPVLVMQKVEDPAKYHAVAAVGLRIADVPSKKAEGPPFQLAAAALQGVYVHDDRYGPYLLAKPNNSRPGRPLLSLRIVKGSPPTIPEVNELWQVHHTLVPTHAKVRLSFSELYKMGFQAGRTLVPFMDSLSSSRPYRPIVNVWVQRSHVYVEALARIGEGYGAEAAIRLAKTVPLSRYVGVIRFIAHSGSSSGTPTIDLLVDTTSTFRNPQFLAVLCGQTADAGAEKAAEVLAKSYRCDFVGSS